MRTCSHPEPGKRREVATAVAAKTREIRTTEFFNKYDITDEEKALPEAEVYPGGVREEVARNAYYLLAPEELFLSGIVLSESMEYPAEPKKYCIFNSSESSDRPHQG